MIRPRGHVLACTLLWWSCYLSTDQSIIGNACISNISYPR